MCNAFGISFDLVSFAVAFAALAFFIQIPAVRAGNGKDEKILELAGEGIQDGIIAACERNRVPYVLGGSIRDDGPLPPVYGNVYEAQDAMRSEVRTATTVICIATMLHSIAVGNMTPSFRVTSDGTVRQVYFYCVDVSEFTANKLADRGSLSARSIITNAQDFIVTVKNGLGL